MVTMNTSVSDTTGYSPAFIIQGREPRLPKSRLCQELKVIFEIVRRNIARASEDQKHYYNLRSRVWKPKIVALFKAKQKLEIIKQKMNSEERFEATFQKFRKRVEEENNKRRRVIFIDDNVPTISKRCKNKSGKVRAQLINYFFFGEEGRECKE
ncbi:hypothetical protein CVS40_11095 [Lucilia cuprina]|nr:hypothetical protein CVS40_11095 [Lucilia cuprina]